MSYQRNYTRYKNKKNRERINKIKLKNEWMDSMKKYILKDNEDIYSKAEAKFNQKFTNYLETILTDVLPSHLL